MRYTPFLFFVALGLILASCTAQKKAELDFPKEMLPLVKVEYEKRCRQGEVLYNLNCAGCHNVKIKRRSTIPDFSPEELKGYALRVSNAKHEQNMPDSLVSEEELGIIMSFLFYKKKNDPPLPRKRQDQNLSGSDKASLH